MSTVNRKHHGLCASLAYGATLEHMAGSNFKSIIGLPDILYLVPKILERYEPNYTKESGYGKMRSSFLRQCKKIGYIDEAIVLLCKGERKKGTSFRRKVVLILRAVFTHVTHVFAPHFMIAGRN